MQKSNDTDRQRFASVWNAIEDTPEEAAKMRALSESTMKAETDANKSSEGGNPTTEVTLWLDVEILEKFKSSGEGWQTRINDALKSWVRTHA